MLLADYPKSNWQDAGDKTPTCECGSIGFVRCTSVGLCRVIGWECIGCHKQTIHLPPTPNERNERG